MRVLVQRCDKASVKVDDKIVGKIDNGIMLLVGFTHTDTSKEIDYMVDKVINLTAKENNIKMEKIMYFCSKT